MFASSLKEDKGPLLSEGRKTELWYHLGQTADRVTSGTDWHSGRNGGNGPQRGTPPAEMYWCDWSHNPSFLLMLHLVLSAWLLLSSLSDPKNYLFCLLSHCCSFYCFWTLFLFLLLVTILLLLFPLIWTSLSTAKFLLPWGTAASAVCHSTGLSPTRNLVILKPRIKVWLKVFCMKLIFVSVYKATYVWAKLAWFPPQLKEK